MVKAEDSQPKGRGIKSLMVTRNVSKAKIKIAKWGTPKKDLKIL